MLDLARRRSRHLDLRDELSRDGRETNAHVVLVAEDDARLAESLDDRRAVRASELRSAENAERCEEGEGHFIDRRRSSRDRGDPAFELGIAWLYAKERGLAMLFITAAIGGEEVHHRLLRIFAKVRADVGVTVRRFFEER